MILARTIGISKCLKVVSSLFLALCVMMVLDPTRALAVSEPVQVYWSSADGTYQLSQQASLAITNDDGSNVTAINVDPSTTYQTMLGFGTSLEQTSVANLMAMNSTTRQSVMTKLFDPTNGLGLSLIRVPFGSPDFSNVPYYSYDDEPNGVTDPTLSHFSIQEDITNGDIAVVKQALSINPNIKVYASVWSPPGWMKDNDSLIGGNMLSTYISTYANYLLKAVQAYEAQGIPIYAISVQNEPNFCNNTYPQACWTWQNEASEVNAVKQLFSQNSVTTKVWIGDADFDQYSTFDQPILADSTVGPEVDGVAFHPYAGDPSAMTASHDAYPKVPVYLTERSPGPTDMLSQPIQWLRNYAGFFSWWVPVANTNGGPNVGPYAGASEYRLAVTDPSNPNSVTYQTDYYMFGLYSEFIKPGAVRIGSDPGSSSTVQDVAFRNPNGSIVTLVTNSTSSSQSFKLLTPTGQISASLPTNTGGVYIWTPNTSTTNVKAPLVRTGWTATASTPTDASGDLPANALDGTGDTRWSTGVAQTPGQSFEVDMETPQLFSEISMDSGASNPSDYPRGYQVEVSNNGSTWTTVATGQGSAQVTTADFPPQVVRYIKVVQTGSAPAAWWSIAQFNLLNQPALDRRGWTATASTPTDSFGDVPANVLDGNEDTRWSTGTAQTNGQWFEVNMGQPETFNEITLDCGSNSAGDYPRGYQIEISHDGSNWVSVASGTGTTQDSLVQFLPQTAPYIRVLQTGSSGSWWSVDEFKVYNTALGRAGWTATASTPTDASGDVPSNALDGNESTKWSTGVAQANGQSFEVDMGTSQQFSEITMDSGLSNPSDYPRGYQVEISNDGSSWTTVASGQGSAQVTSADFPPQVARYIKVVQTGSAPAAWWSIAEFNVVD